MRTTKTAKAQTDLSLRSLYLHVFLKVWLCLDSNHVQTVGKPRGDIHNIICHILAQETSVSVHLFIYFIFIYFILFIYKFIYFFFYFIYLFIYFILFIFFFCCLPISLILA